MGMYIGVAFKGYIKPKFCNDDFFENIVWDGCWGDYPDKRFQEFAKQNDRSERIPCGAWMCVPDSWRGNPDYSREFDSKTGSWSFVCNFKRDDEFLQAWFELIPYFVENVIHLETYFEADKFSKAYELVDGKVKLKTAQYIHYS